MKNKENKAVTIILFIPFLIGVLLCKTDRGGFYGNANAYIGIPLCIASAFGNVFWRYYSLACFLSREDIAELKKSSVMKYMTVNSIILSLFSILFFKALSADDFGTAVLVCVIVLMHNIPMINTRKDLKTNMICLSIIMLLVSFIICLNLNEDIIYASIYRKR